MDKCPYQSTAGSVVSQQESDWSTAVIENKVGLFVFTTLVMMLPYIKCTFYALCHAFDIFDNSCNSFMAGISIYYYFADEENETQKLSNLHK